MTYNEYLKAVRKRYLEYVKNSPRYAFLCEANLVVATVPTVHHYRRLDSAITLESKGKAFLPRIWQLEGRYGILPPKGRKDTHRKRLKRIVAARLQWLANQAE